METAVIFFDGMCNLCNSAVQFVIQRDPQGRFRFAPLQGAFAQQKLSQFKVDTLKSNSIFLLEEGKLYSASSAALRIARKLKGAWPFLYIFWVIPKIIRDFFYDIIAKNRYRFWGKRAECMVPSPELRARFL